MITFGGSRMQISDSWKWSFLVLRFGLAAALIIGCCLSASCGNPWFSSEDKRDMEQVLEQAMAENGIPGAIVGVWAPDRGTWVHAEGTADLATGRDIQPTDKVRIASITKTFTATVILQLVDEGKLSLDDTLDRWAPEVPYSDEITIRQMCNHTAGIYSMTEDEGFDEALLDNPLGKWTVQEMVDIVLEHEPYFAPGEGWHYSDIAYALLGMIIENVTGDKIEKEIQRRIIDELGLKNTSFPEGPEMTGEYSHGYVDRDGTLVDYTETDPSAPWAAGAIISNLYDLKTWAKALADGTLLAQATQEERLTWVDMPGLERFDGKYGLGISSMGGFMGHNGEILGYNSTMYYLPSKDATVVVLLNKCRPGHESPADVVFLHIAKILFPHEVPW